MNNIFNTPRTYRKHLLDSRSLVSSDITLYSGKSFICLFLTRFCGVGCPFCFFKSPPHKGTSDIKDAFTEEGVVRFIKFANEANVGYLQISGGGEPFLKKKALLQCISEVNADRIMLVTSGVWAMNEDVAKAYVDAIATAISKRQKPARVSIRLSLSEGHSHKLNVTPLKNLLKIFENNYRSHPSLTLQLKTFENDPTLWNYLETLPGYKLEEMGHNISDDIHIEKVIPWKKKITFSSGYHVLLGISRVFDPNLRPNLNDPCSRKKTIDVYNHDLELSERDFPSVVFNSDGKKGLDWLVEYNGNVCTWQNRVQDNTLNIYEDDFETTQRLTFNDPLTLSFIEKGSLYRQSIVSEVSPRAVTLVKSVSVRDYAGNCLFEDEKIRLYYCIRALQDYMKEGKVNKNELFKLPQELLKAINSSKESLIALYRNAHYSVVDQEIGKQPNFKEFRDFLELLKLGHFEVSKKQIEHAITYYNNFEECQEKITNLNEISPEFGYEIEKRLTDRVVPIKSMERLTNNLKGANISSEERQKLYATQR